MVKNRVSKLESRNAKRPETLRSASKLRRAGGRKERKEKLGLERVLWGIGFGGGFIEILDLIRVRGGRVKIRGKRKGRVLFWFW